MKVQWGVLAVEFALCGGGEPALHRQSFLNNPMVNLAECGVTKD